MSQPHFIGKGYYRFKICVNERCILTRGELMSAIHKLVRRGLDGELCELLCAFFTAVATNCAKGKGEMESECKGAITNTINRFSIALIEDGPLMNCTKLERKRITTLLIDLYASAHAQDWDTCINAVKSICELIVGVCRGRLGSVGLNYIKHKRYVSGDDPAALSMQTALDPQVMFTNDEVSLRTVQNVLQLAMPEVSPLLEVNKIAQSKEARRQLYLAAIVCRSARPERVEFAQPPGVLNRELLDSFGVFDDIHIKGRHSAEAWNVFFKKGCRVANATSASLFGHSYGNLERLYCEGKHAEYLDSQRTKIANVSGRAKRTLEGKPSSKSKNKKKHELPAGALCFEHEQDLIQIEGDMKLGGFKNGTLIGGSLNLTLGEIEKGSLVFFKMGEPLDNVQFSIRCSEWQKELGLAFTNQQVVWVKPHPEWWAGISAPKNAQEEKWSQCMQKSLASRIKLHTHDGYMPCLIAPHFEGTRGTVSRICKSGLSTVCAQNQLKPLLIDLAKVLLFSRYVGITDTSLFNMLVSTDMRVLQVDMGIPSALQLSKYLSKGLLTSHKLPKTVFGNMMCVICKNYAEIAVFMRQVMTSSVKSNYETPPPPFRENTIAALELGNASPIVTECMTTTPSPHESLV